MLETIFALAAAAFLCLGDREAIGSILNQVMGPAQPSVLQAAAGILSLLLFGMVFLLVRLGAGRALPVLRELDWKKLWNSFRQWLRPGTALHLILGVAGAAAAGTLLLMGAYLLPTGPIHRNLEEEVPYNGKSWEQAYPSLSPLCTSMLDGFTDSIILLQSADDTQDTLLNKAMLVYCGSAGSGMDAPSTLYARYHDGEPIRSSWTYPRYWHGYLILTKPLLSVFNYRQLGILNGMVQLLLTLLVCWRLKRLGLGRYAPAWMLVWLMLMPAALAVCLQFTPCYLIAAVAVLVLLWLPEERVDARGWLVFLYSGIATAYFDFLTYPLAAFGIPAVFFALRLRAASTEKKLGRLAQSGLAWGWGYAGMWASKWLLATVLTGQNVLKDAAEQAALRSSSSAAVNGMNEIAYSPLFTIGINLGTFLVTPVTLGLAVLLLDTVRRVRRAGPLPWRKIRGQLLLYGGIGVLPMVWYVLLQNHSLVHSWFTNKASSVLVLAVSFLCIEILELTRGRPEKCPNDGK